MNAQETDSRIANESSIDSSHQLIKWENHAKEKRRFVSDEEGKQEARSQKDAKEKGKRQITRLG